MGLFGILLGLGILIWLSFRGWSVLLLTPAAALMHRVAVIGAGALDSLPHNGAVVTVTQVNICHCGKNKVTVCGISIDSGTQPWG